MMMTDDRFRRALIPAAVMGCYKCSRALICVANSYMKTIRT